MLTAQALCQYAGASDYALLSREGASLLLLFYPYRPFCAFPADCLPIDAYYPASNRSYHLAKAACAFAKEQGFSAHFAHDFSYKQALRESGKCFCGRNSLAVHYAYGSYFVLQALAISPPLPEETPLQPSLQPDLCQSCRHCIEACPTGALGEACSDFSRCIRALEDHPSSEKTFPLLGNSLLGCALCRQVCPHNRHIACTEPEQSLVRLCKIDRLLAFDKETRWELEAVLGKNLVSPKLLLPQVFSYAALHGHPALPRALENWRNHPSPAVAASAAMAQSFFDSASQKSK